jgi:N-carbamoylputrescine amidase
LQYGEQQHDSWETIQRSHAIANGCYVAVSNRVGHEAPDGGPGLEFWGQSFVADPSGKIIARAGVADEEILLVEIDPAAIDRQRTHWPFLRDRRIDAYSDINKRLID